MAKGKYYTPEFKEQAVKMAVGLDCTYDLLHTPYRASASGWTPILTGRGQHGRAADRRQV
jgi:hypothetical protein